MKVFIYSIPRESSFGIHDWTSDNSGKKLKKTKIGKCTDAIVPLYNPKYGGLANGLSYKPWIESGVQKIDEVTKRPLTLQDKMEKKWNLESGYLTNRSFQKGVDSPSKLTYFQTAVWKLNDGATVLDLDNFEDEMFYYVCLDSKYIANSEKEWREHKWPKATHYIALENEAEELKFSRNYTKSRAFSKLHDKDFTPSMKEKFVAILELGSSRINLTNEQVDNLLYEYIDKSNFQPNSNIDKFEALFTLLSTPTGREEIEARFLLKKALDSRVVYEKQGSYTWVNPKGTIVLGETYQEAVAFLLNPKKSALVEELNTEIKLRNI